MVMQVVEVNVPADVRPGDEFLITFNGQEVYVTCPQGCKSGDPISFEIDVCGIDEPVEVTIPEGCYPGMKFSVTFEGDIFEIDVPEGSEPGSTVLVVLPARQVEDELQSIHDVSSESACKPSLSSDATLQPGDGVVIDGLQSKPYLNGERGSLISWDAIKGRWKVSIGHSKDEAPSVLALRPANLRPLQKQQRSGNDSPVSVCAV
mmetsp:Transcript_13078/g.33534  ORF Transcript_13078/g.33534 Transcript_13078/m.33534 type:complete len:205 (+) Transcript_13078:51-665(+)